MPSNLNALNDDSLKIPVKNRKKHQLVAVTGPVLIML